ncbi:MAG: hypothetical protein OXN97_02145 [Bryobacterales bacterium]|nr:hypothetical protein [Bryobacterales bacterium]
MQQFFDALHRHLRMTGSPNATLEDADVACPEDMLGTHGQIAMDHYEDRMGTSQSPSFLRILQFDLLEKAEDELRAGHSQSSITTAGVVLDDFPSMPKESLVLACLLRAEGCIASRNHSECESDLGEMLDLLQSLKPLPAMCIEGLMASAVRFGPDRILDLIESSPMVNRLFPLVTALREELGIETRVPQEVAEVANDIRLCLERWRQAGVP